MGPNSLGASFTGSDNSRDPSQDEVSVFFGDNFYLWILWSSQTPRVISTNRGRSAPITITAWV